MTDFTFFFGMSLGTVLGFLLASFNARQERQLAAARLHAERQGALEAVRNSINTEFFERLEKRASERYKRRSRSRGSGKRRDLSEGLSMESSYEELSRSDTGMYSHPGGHPFYHPDAPPVPDAYRHHDPPPPPPPPTRLTGGAAALVPARNHTPIPQPDAGGWADETQEFDSYDMPHSPRKK